MKIKPWSILRLVPLLLGCAAASFTAKAADPKVRIGYPIAPHGEVALVLEKTDIAARHGLAVETTFFQYGPPQIEALAAKSLDVAFLSIVPTANFLSKQPGVVQVIASLGNSYHGLLVPADSPVKSLADFKGRTIAVAFGTDAHVDLLAALKGAGLDPQKDVKINNVPPNEQPAAFEQRLADGVVFRQPQLLKYTEKGGREIQRWPHHLWVIARTDFLEGNPGLREKLVAAIQEAAFYVTQHPEQTARWFGEQLRTDASIVQRVSAENPLYKEVRSLQDVDVTPPPALKAFAAKRAGELVEFGLSRKAATFVFE